MTKAISKQAARLERLASDKKRLTLLDKKYWAAKTGTEKNTVWAEMSAIIFREPD